MTDFRLGLGHVTLDFLATLGGRPGNRIERLAAPDDLSRWIVEAGMATAAGTAADTAMGAEARMAAMAGMAAAPPPSRELLDDARDLREAIRRVLDCAREGSRPEGSDLALVNEWARSPIPAPQIGPDFARRLVGADAVSGALSYIARESVDLVTGPELGRVRSCAGCSLQFIDRSRPGTRRWCSMERCGNRSKTARYRHNRST
jgi:predicted RNA-binding Zn ribbon-like protein